MIFCIIFDKLKIIFDLKLCIQIKKPCKMQGIFYNRIQSIPPFPSLTILDSVLRSLA